MRLIVASNNLHKIEEIKEMLIDSPYDVVGLMDINFDEIIEETGTSFLENAMIKAKTIHQRFPNDAVLADDSGFCIHHFKDGPGIYSARFMGENTSYIEKNSKIIEEMENASNRSAYFVCSMVFLFSGYEYSTIQYVYGTVSKTIRGNKGFGYDPIFIPNGYETSFAEDPLLKAKISHRSKALREVVDYVKNTQF